MKKKLATTLAIWAFHGLSVKALATEMIWNGSIDADGTRTFSSIHEAETNQEINLGAHVKFDDKVSLDLGITSNNGSVPNGGGQVDERWSDIRFNGVSLNIQFTENVTAHAGDLVYTEGAFRYFEYHSTGLFAAAFPDSHLRGASLSWNELNVAAGISDISSHITNSYLSYTLHIKSAAIKPYSYLQISDSYDTLHFVGGFAFDGHWNKNSLTGNMSYHQEKWSDPTFTFLFEPHLEREALSMDVTAFYAHLPKRAATIAVPDHWFTYIEPQMQLHPWFRLGVSSEIHQYTNAAGTLFRSLLMAHVTPHEQVELRVFGGPSKLQAERYWLIGGELQAQF